MFGRMVDQLSAAAATTSPSGTTSTSAQAAAALMRFGGLSANSDRAVDKTGEDPIREEDGMLSVDNAETMLKWHAEAIGRCVELSSSNDVLVSSYGSAADRVSLLTSGAGRNIRLRYCGCCPRRSEALILRPPSSREYL